MKKVLEQYTRDFVYEFSEAFDRDVYEELTRIQGIIFWSLDDFYLYGFHEKPIEQIILEDMGLTDEDVIKTTKSYLEDKVVSHLIQIKYLKEFSNEELLEKKISWI